MHKYHKMCTHPLSWESSLALSAKASSGFSPTRTWELCLQKFCLWLYLVHTHVHVYKALTHLKLWFHVGRKSVRRVMSLIPDTGVDVRGCERVGVLRSTKEGCANKLWMWTLHILLCCLSPVKLAHDSTGIPHCSRTHKLSERLHQPVCLLS